MLNSSFRLLFKANVICTLPGLAESRTVERTRSESDIHFSFNPLASFTCSVLFFTYVVYVEQRTLKSVILGNKEKDLGSSRSVK